MQQFGYLRRKEGLPENGIEEQSRIEQQKCWIKHKIGVDIQLYPDRKKFILNKKSQADSR